MSNAFDSTIVPKVSVIIPVYNSELYLEDCIKSVLNQTLHEIEIILVDDGSKDRSAEICDEVSCKDDRIVVIHQENRGICGARNAGLKVARGEYITFCDNDDYVCPNCYELAYKCATNNNVDVVRFRRKHTMVGKVGTISTSYPDYQDHVIEIKDWEDYLEVVSKTGYGIWAGIYKHTIFTSGEFEFDVRVKYGYEDNIISGFIYRYSKTIYLLNDELYEWIQRVSHSASMKKGYTVFLNRFEGMIIWKQSEDLLFESIGDKKGLHEDRQYDYMRMVIEEITNSGIHGKQAKKALEYAKEEMSFIPKEAPNFEERLINENQIQLFMLNRYFKVGTRKLKQIVRKAVKNRML